MKVTGSGWLDITSAPIYAPGEHYRVAQNGEARAVRADTAGRLSFTVDLGPAHSDQQRKFDEAELATWEHSVVSITEETGSEP